MEQEKWRPVVRFEGFYEVSDLGRVRSFRLSSEGRPLKPSLDRYGYLFVTLYAPGQRTKRFAIHQLVLTAFRGPCPPGMEARHFPLRDKTCNYIDNLVWDTKSQNQRDRTIHGTDTGSVQRRKRLPASRTSCPERAK